LLLEVDMNYEQELVKFLKSSEKYVIIRENLNLLNNYLLNESAQLIMESGDQEKIINAAKQYIEDVDKKIDKLKEKAKKDTKSTAVWALIGAGIFILGPMLGIAAIALGGTTKSLLLITIGGVIMAISKLVAIIFLIVGIVKGVSAVRDIKQLKDLKKKLGNFKDRAKDEKIKIKIDTLINKIDSRVD
jgi:VIT1/CCC1 family predicted Fe2+/Mn2+ transporter